MRWLMRLRRRCFHLWFLLRRPMTLGVRALVMDEKGVLLIRHTYAKGWHLPGGGVDPGETAQEALGRELMEETGLKLAGAAELRSVHFNRASSRRDHVLFYVAGKYEVARPFVPNREIAECGFFPLDGLPEGVHSSTMRRIEEVLGKATVSRDW